MSLFYLALKSTIDKHAVDLAADLGLEHRVDLDDVVNVEELLTADVNVLLWQILNFSPAPREPLFDLTFGLGAKTVEDPSNYKLSELAASIGSRIPSGHNWPVVDYSGDSAGAEQLGSLIVSHADLTPQEVGQDSGIRLFSIDAKVLQWRGF